MRNGILFLACAILLMSCGKRDLITNPQRLHDIQKMLQVQKEMTSKSLTPLWDIFQQNLSKDERQAMEFLYAYMPLSDLADYTPEFFLSNVRYSLKARKEMAWGKLIPEDVFLHFVLPLRVNNENLDHFREQMYDEIKARVQGLGMKEAALEINHWCHEKVTYRGTDERTSSPLAAICKAFGRCGEESTFTVTALRTAGIPARQVYTPRWAHTDDNHAWVEVWIDGKWYFLGACEPDVDLNMGWFTEPSSRVMLVHTRTYGRYFGNEPVLTDADRFSELNLTSHYTTTKTVTVLVKNPDGTPADSARVEYQLYNYAEFYPIAVNYTDKNGLSRFLTGMGDLVVWAAKKGVFAWKKLSVPSEDTLVLVLGTEYFTSLSDSFDLIPPPVRKVDNNIPEELRKQNTLRLAREDSIRNAYCSTFKDSAWIASFAARHNLRADEIMPFIKKSYGNWKEITSFIETHSGQQRDLMIRLLSQLSDKDFADVKEQTLTDHLAVVSGMKPSVANLPQEIFDRYILSPRIANEMLSPWRKFLLSSFGQEMGNKIRSDISVLTTWINANLKVNEMANKHSRAPLTPAGVYNLRVTDPLSRDIFFVAVCRTFGIPARLNPETKFPEYYEGGKWLRAGFGSQKEKEVARGFLKFVNKNNGFVPMYYKHFTTGILRDGFFRTLEFPEGATLTENKVPAEVDAGSYMLVTGNRMNDGSVLCRISFFEVNPGKLSVIPVEIRKQTARLISVGKLKLDDFELQTTSGKKENIKNLLKGRVNALIILEPDKEPSKHVLHDIGQIVDKFNQWEGSTVFVVPAENRSQTGVLATYKLPVKSSAGTDVSGELIRALSNLSGHDIKNRLPLVTLCSADGEIVIVSEGYMIETGERILKTADQYLSKK